MSKLNWNRLGAFAAGTFLGGYVLGLFSKITGRVSGGQGAMPTKGTRTSEFFVTVLVVLAAILADAANWIPPRYAWFGGVLVAVGYVISRGLAKTEPR